MLAGHAEELPRRPVAGGGRDGGIPAALTIRRGFITFRDFAFAYITRGVAYNDKGLYDLAIREYAEAPSLKPDEAFAYINLGDAYANKGQLDRAIREYAQAIRLEPDNESAYTNRGLANRNLGWFERAIEDFRAAKRLKVE